MLHQSKRLPKGKKPAREDAVTFKMSKYVDIDAWAKKLHIPRRFGHEALVDKADWGTLGNDVYGCCVLASMAHRHQLWTAIGGGKAKFTKEAVLGAYSALTGFDPANPGQTDNGADMGQAADYNRKTGIRDTNGILHTIEAYLKIDKGSLVEHYIAMHLFGLVDIGFNYPTSADEQFRNGKPWDIAKGATLDGEGHCVPLLARRSGLYSVTWGKVHPMTVRFFERYNDESVAYVETEMLKNGVSPEGFDAKSLLEDLARLH